MKDSLLKTARLLLALLLACAPAAARQRPNLVEIEDGPVGISFEPPPGVTAATEKELAAVRAAGVPVRFLYRDAGWNTTVTFNTMGEGYGPDALPRLQKDFEAEFEKRDPGGEWLTREPVTINGLKWVRLRRRSAPAADAEVNDYYLTTWAGRAVFFNFSSPVAGYESRRAAIEKSARTIQLSLIVVAPIEAPAPRPKTPARRPARRTRRP